MSTAWLWTPAQLQDALQINAPEALKGVRGLSIDTRTLDAGDLFVAVRDVRDGHDFVEAAFAKGAARLAAPSCSAACATCAASSSRAHVAPFSMASSEVVI